MNAKLNPDLFEDIRELCICCAQGIVVISKRYNENPQLVSKFFLEVFKEILDRVDKEN